MDHPCAGAGRRHEPGRGGEIVGTAQELGVPAAGADRAVREPRPKTIYGGPVVADGGAADRAVAGGQPDRSVGGDPARNVDHGGDGRRGGSLVRLCCRTASAGVPPAASARSLIAGQRNVAHSARSSSERRRKPRVEACGSAAGRAGAYGGVAGASWPYRADGARPHNPGAAFPATWYETPDR